MDMYLQAKDSIEKYVYTMLTRRQRIAINVCNNDLYHGPLHNAGGKSRFITWLPVAKSAMTNFPNSLWYDLRSSVVLEREPYIETFEEEYYHFNAMDIKKIVYGELASYI